MRKGKSTMKTGWGVGEGGRNGNDYWNQEVEGVKKARMGTVKRDRNEKNKG